MIRGRVLLAMVAAALVSSGGAALASDAEAPDPAAERAADGTAGTDETDETAGVAPAGELHLAGDHIDPSEVFVTANAAYEAGEYATAIATYERLIDHGLDNGHVWYNLGNARLRTGDLGGAIAAYRRAQSALPRDEDVAANLAFARGSARDALAPPEPSAVARTLLFWHFGLSRRELAAGLLVANALLWVLLGAALFAARSEVLRWAATAAAIVSIALAGSLAWKAAVPRRVAVILPPEVDIRSGTGVETVVRFKLHAGTEVRALEERESWVRIALPDGQQGWVQAEHADVVVL